MKRKVSIITINYNALDDTLVFLDELSNSMLYANLEAEVIVVDNASQQCPAEELKAYPWVKLVQSKSNLGFAGGNNLGALDSTGDYLFFVNNDAVLNLLELEELIDQYEANPEFGLLNPVIHNADGSVQFAGYTALNKLTGRNKLLKQVSSETGIRETSYPHGAAMLISRENFGKVGLLKENYFLYYEELDWGTQVRKAGLKIGVCLSSKIIHKESVSVGRISDCKLYFMTRNRILYARKHFSGFEKICFSLFFLLLTFPKSLLQFWIKGERSSVKTFLAAIWWHFQNDVDSFRLGYKFDHLLKTTR